MAFSNTTLPRPPASALSSAIEALAARFGNSLITSQAVREQHAHTTTWLPMQPPDAVVMAQSTADVQDVVRICAKHGVPVIPFGTGTSLEGQVNAPAGGVCIDITLGDLALYISSVKVGETGKAFIADKDMNILAAPQASRDSAIYAKNSSDKITLKNITQFENEEIKAAYTAMTKKLKKLQKNKKWMKTKKPFYFDFKIDGSRFVGLFAPFPAYTGLDWQTGVIIPEDEFFYFVRRNAKDELYRRVLERYIAMATEAGVTQAVYPEGGLTKDGALREPRFGVLDYMLRGYHHEGPRDLVFVPLGLNYDRVLEDRTQLRSGDAAAPRVGKLAALWRTLAFAGGQLGLLLRSRWHRFGYACVNFGSPVSVRAWCASRGLVLEQLDKAARQAEVAELGRHLMAQVGRLVPVLPVPLVATLMVEDLARARSEFEIKAEVEGWTTNILLV